MTLTRYDVLSVDATVIVGILVLLTLTNLGIETLFPGENFQFMMNALTVVTILPFMASAISVLSFEIQQKRQTILEKLEKMKNLKEFADRIQEIEKEIKETRDSLKKIPVDRICLERNEATIWSLRFLQVGFYYLAITLLIIVILSATGVGS